MAAAGSSLRHEPAAPISDYGKLHLGAAEYTTVEPEDPAAALHAVRRALAEGRDIRVRGSGHSLSGMSLPREGEMLLRTRGLDAYRVTVPGRIAVGAGAVLWDVRDFVAGRGWLMPVYNGGWAGPSVGGYVCAGGMGLRVPPSDGSQRGAGPGADAIRRVSISERHGGFWEHVHAVTLIDGRGELHRIEKSEAMFPWLFASCGQLGLIVEVELTLIRGQGEDGLPVGAAGRIPRLNRVDPQETDGIAPETGIPWLYWFSYLVAVEREAAAWAAVDAWLRRHGDVLRPTGGWVGPVVGGAPAGFRYLVRHRRFTPPLLYPRHEDFLLLGVMAECGGVGRIESDERLVAAERDFVAAAHEGGFRLYAQAENLSRSLDWDAYLGPERIGRLRELKARFDPDFRINPGEVLASATPRPLRLSSQRKLARAVRRTLAPSDEAAT